MPKTSPTLIYRELDSCLYVLADSNIKNICNCLHKYGVLYKFDDATKEQIIERIKDEFQFKVKRSAFEFWFEREYREFVDTPLPISKNSFADLSSLKKPKLLVGDTLDYFKDIVYLQRNRYAHNLMSYQQNVPTLSELSSNEFKRPNHFRIFAILILIDEIFMELFRRFLDYREAHVYN